MIIYQVSGLRAVLSVLILQRKSSLRIFFQRLQEF